MTVSVEVEKRLIVLTANSRCQAQKLFKRFYDKLTLVYRNSKLPLSPTVPSRAFMKSDMCALLWSPTIILHARRHLVNQGGVAY